MTNSRPVRKAVLPVAGLGTRFLPATKAVPKEMLPVVDKPVVQYAVEEAREAGIEQFVFVTGRGKTVISDHFDHAYELESQLRAKEKTAELKSLLEMLPPTGSVGFVRQQNPLGLGHAVWCARHFIGNEPFAVLLPDDLLVGKPGGLAQMVEAYRRVGGGCIVAAEERSREETKRYGVVDPGKKHDNATEVKALVEKPDPAKAPSTLCIIGRYILQPEIFTELDRQERGAGGEIQLTDSMARLTGRMPFHAATDVNREDNPEPGTDASERKRYLTSPSRLDNSIKRRFLGRGAKGWGRWTAGNVRLRKFRDGGTNPYPFRGTKITNGWDNVPEAWNGDRRDDFWDTLNVLATRGDRPRLMPRMESRMPGNLHVRFGERDGETSHSKVVWRFIPTLLEYVAQLDRLTRRELHAAVVAQD